MPSLLISDLIQLDSFQWKSSLICSLFDETSAKAILALKIHDNPNPTYIWTPSTSGKFTTNSTYLSIIKTNLPELASQQSSIWKDLWKL